jgi:methyl-accepting chemotaxis protein
MANPEMPQLDVTRAGIILRLEVQPLHNVVRDTKKNSRWILPLLLLIAVVLCLDAYLATLIPNGFMITEQSGQHPATINGRTALYFTAINMTTVGFGDIFPLTQSARVLSMFNAFFGLIMFAILVSLLALAFSPSSDTPLSGSAPNLPREGTGGLSQNPDRKRTSDFRLSVINARSALENLHEQIKDILKEDARTANETKPDESECSVARSRIEKLREGLENLNSQAYQLIEVTEAYEALLEVASAVQNSKGNKKPKL